MIIGVPKELTPGEKRVALTPDGVKELAGIGCEIWVEAGAGEAAFFSDAEYADSGAKIQSSRDQLLGGADCILRVVAPLDGEPLDDIGKMRSGAMWMSFLFPAANPRVTEAMRAQGISSFALDLMPRISRAQSMDVLSSMSTIAGYKAVLLSADYLPRFFPMLMTAAGTLAPARVLVIGAGVAGLQAIATAKRLGARVEAFDVRPAVKEQIESLGAKFIGLNLLTEEAEDAGGYAKEVSGDTHAKELDLIASRLPNINAVITTALIPGKKAPVLITSDMLKKMPPGSVIVDLAAMNGGNCEATVPGQVVVQDKVTIVGRTDLISGMSSDASRMYSKNLTTFLRLMISDKGEFNLDLTDEIIKGTLVTHQSQIVHEVVRLAVAPGGHA